MEIISAAPAVIRSPEIQDIFVRGILEVEDLGDCVRFVMYVDQVPLVPGPIEHVVRAHIVMQWSDVPSCIRAAALAFFRWLKRHAKAPEIHLLH